MRIPWPQFIRDRWEVREAEADAAEDRLAAAKVQHAHVRRLTDESREIKKLNGFTEAIRSAMGVANGGTAPRPGNRHA